MESKMDGFAIARAKRDAAILAHVNALQAENARLREALAAIERCARGWTSNAAAKALGRAALAALKANP